MSSTTAISTTSRGSKCRRSRISVAGSGTGCTMSCRVLTGFSCAAVRAAKAVSLAHTRPDLTAHRAVRTAAAGALRATLQPEIEFADQLVVVELVGAAALEGDLAVHDDIAAIGDADGLVEVLLGHQHG